MTQETSANKNQAPSKADFAFLGLRFSEARTAVIRKAAKRRARKMKQEPTSESSFEQAADVAKVALATYRLLDPRGRRKFWERLHLSVGTAFEDESCERRSVSRLQLPDLSTSDRPVQESDCDSHWNISP
jgi:hypothetical protein